MSTFDLQLPDGRVIQGIPEGTTKAEIAAKLGIPPDQQQPASEPPSALGEAARVAGTSLYGGVTAIPRMVMEGGNWLEEQFPTPDWTKLPIPGGQQIAEADKAIRRAVKPQTETGQALGRIGESAVAAVTGPGGLAAPIRSAIVGASAGVGAEGAAKMFGDTALTRTLGGLTGGLVGGIGTMAKTNRGALAREALDDVKADDLQEALRRMRFAEEQGIPINLSQAMPASSNVDALVDALATSQRGTNVRAQLNAQPALVAQRAERLTRQLPGTQLPQRIMANEAQQAATEVIKQGMQKAGQAWRALAPQAKALPSTALKEFDDYLDDLIRSQPNTDRAQLAAAVKQAIRNPASQADDAVKLVDVKGRPMPSTMPTDEYLTDALQLKSAIDSTLGGFGPRVLNTPTPNARITQQAQQIRNYFNENIVGKVPELQRANKAYEAVMEGVEGVKASVTGDVAGRRGAVAGVNAPQGKMFSVFDAGTAKGTPSEILTLERDFRKAGQSEAFLNSAKTWIADRVTKAASAPTASSREAGDTALNLLKVFGDPRSLNKAYPSKAAQGFNDILAGMARSQGVPETEFVRGFKNFMTVVTDAANRPASISGATGAELRKLAESGITRNLGQVSIITPLRQPALAWARWLEQDALSKMDELLTSPEGVAMLIQLGKSQPYSQKALTAIGTFLGTAAATTGNESGANPPGVMME